MDKQKALDLFEKFWEDYDLHVTVQIAQIDNKWPDVILNEGDNDWQQGLYVGWMNAMKARADLAAEQIEALRHERNVLQKICAERSDDIDRLETERGRLAKSLSRLLWLHDDDKHGQTPVASEYEWAEAWEAASEDLTKIYAQENTDDT